MLTAEEAAPEMNRLRSLTACALLLPGAGASATDGVLADAARTVGMQVGAAIDHDLSDERWAVAEREFTSATVENSLKWTPLASAPGVYDFTRADAAVGLAEQKGLRVRGHTLFWDRLNGMPAWLPGEVGVAPDPVARLTELMQAHAATVVGRYAGRLAHWDVVNEPLEQLGGDLDPENFYFQTLGEQYIDVGFHAAHAADPDALLFVNEVTTEFLPEKFDALIALVERLLARGVPVHGVGLQGHFFGAPDRASLQARLERIAALGLVVELTEVDILLSMFASEPDPLAAQARAYADVFAACLAVPACTGVTTWGIDDADTWLDSFFLTQGTAPNRPLLFDDARAPKPAYDAALQALLCPPAPRIGCTAAGKASLSVKESRPGKEKLAVSLAKLSDATTAADFGDPVGGATAFGACLYDAADALVASLVVDRAGESCGTKPCWKAQSTRRHRYKDKDASSDGVQQVQLKSGAAGKGKLVVKAKNDAAKGRTGLPTGVAAALQDDASATMQVTTSNAACFAATMGTVKKADGSRFQAVAR